MLHYVVCHSELEPNDSLSTLDTKPQKASWLHVNNVEKNVSPFSYTDIQYDGYKYSCSKHAVSFTLCSSSTFD